MGLPICARLLGAGFEVVASDARAEREPAVREIGAGWASDTPGLLQRVAVLVTVLPGGPELEEAMAVATAHLRPSMAWVDMTSASPPLGRALAARVERRGVECLEAALGGGEPAAQAGRLQLFVGGEPDVVERHRPLLAALGSIEHVGGHGAGYLTKLLVNLLWFGQAVAVAEELLLAG